MRPIKVASYNIHKAVGLDRRRDPDRVLNVLREIDADVIALQEVDMRFGSRASVLPRASIDEHSPWQAVHLRTKADSLGWHGNALLVRRGIKVVHAEPVPLPTLEPRGAILAELDWHGQRLLAVGMHLDLSGLRRRHQLRAVIDHVARQGERKPAVLMGDFNQWSRLRGAMKEFGGDWEVLHTGKSFPARQPIAPLDRIVVSGLNSIECGVHHSKLAAAASDHLPVFAQLESA